MTCVQWLKGFLRAKIGHSSTRRGSSFAARSTEHFLTVSFFYLCCVVVVFFSEPRPVVHVSKYPLRRSTAGLHFYGIPSSTGCEPERIEHNRFLVKPQNPLIDDKDDIEEIGVKKLSYSQSVVYAAYDSLRCRPTRTSKTSNCVRCWLHH